MPFASAHLQDLGTLVVAWSPIEALSTLLLTRLIQDEGEICCALLHQVANLHHRLEMVKDVADHAGVSREIKKEAKALCGEIKRLSAERNRFVHGMIVPQTDGSIILIERLTRKEATKTERINRAHGLKSTNDVNMLRERLRVFIFGEDPMVVRQSSYGFVRA